MAIKKYYADADTTITNAFKDTRFTKTSRATGSNMGLADSLEVFSIYGQGSSSAGFSQELSRILVKFPVTTTDDSTNSIAAHRTAGTIPASGSVKFYLRLYNVEHDRPVPRSAKYNVFAVSSSWEEGRGLDMDEYKDITRGNVGANWISRAGSTAWVKAGGDYHTASTDLANIDDNDSLLFSKTLEDTDSMEDLEVDVTSVIERWIAGTHPDGSTFSNYGFGIMLTSSQEAKFTTSDGLDYSAANGGILHNPDGATTSYYTKKFSARGSEFFFQRPALEARWDSAKKDDRGNFYYSSSLAPADDNINTLYYYNYYRGQLRDIPGTDGNPGKGNLIYVTLFSDSGDGKTPDPNGTIELSVDGTYVSDSTRNTVVTGGWVETGIYTASFAVTGATEAGEELTKLYDVWYITSSAGEDFTNGIQVNTGSIIPEKLSGYDMAPEARRINSITNLKDIYSFDEKARFRVYSRHKNWNPTIYTRASAQAENDIIESGSYRIYRVIDDLSAISYGTASATLHTQMSFDVSGNYFDLEMNMLEPGFAYAIKLAYYNGSVGAWVEQPEIFKFRVEKWE